LVNNREIQSTVCNDLTIQMGICLNVLECVGNHGSPQSINQIAERLSLPIFDIKDIIQILERRRYIVRSGKTRGYTLTAKAHAVGIVAPYAQHLLKNAPTIMRVLSDDIYQSCNLSVPFNYHPLVIAQTPSPGLFNLNIPVGFRYDAHSSAAGLVFRKFGDHFTSSERFKRSKSAEDIRQKAESCPIIARGCATAESFLEGVTDLSCPILLYGDHVIAALTVPYLAAESSMGVEKCVDALLDAASALSRTLDHDTFGSAL